MRPDPDFLRPYVVAHVVPALPGWAVRHTVDEREIDVDVDGAWEVATWQTPACVLSRPRGRALQLVGLHQARGEPSAAVSIGLYIADAYFTADEPPAAPAPHDGVARHQLPALSGRFSLRDSALVEAIRAHALPWFERASDPAGLFAVLDAGGEFERVAAALLRIRDGDPAGARALTEIVAQARSDAWRARYVWAAARLGVRIPEPAG